MSDLIDQFLERQKKKAESDSYDLSENTYDSYLTSCRVFREFMQEYNIESVIEVDKRNIDDFLELYLVDRVSGSTVKSYYTSLRPLFHFLERRDHYAEDQSNPMEEVSLSNYNIDTTPSKREKKEPVYLEPEEKDALVENVHRPKIRNKLIINLLWSTGMRASGAVGIKIEDIDRDDRSIFLPAARNKSEEDRTVWYDDNTAFLMNQWLDGGYRDAFVHADSSYLLISYKSDDMTTTSLARVVKGAAEDAGLQSTIDQNGREYAKITSHVLRHSYGVQKARSGMPIKQLAMLMGHSDTSTTEKYMKLAKRDLRQAAKEHQDDISLDSAP